MNVENCKKEFANSYSIFFGNESDFNKVGRVLIFPFAMFLLVSWFVFDYTLKKD